MTSRTPFDGAIGHKLLIFPPMATPQTPTLAEPIQASTLLIIGLECLSCYCKLGAVPIASLFQ